MQLTLVHIAAIAAGGAAGALTRALLSQALESRFPWATLVVNVAGSFLIGWILGQDATRDLSRSFWAVGFCGALTTFSTFSYQTLMLMLEGRYRAALANALLSCLLCFIKGTLKRSVAMGN